MKEEPPPPPFAARIYWLWRRWMDTPLVWHLILRRIHAWFTAKMGVRYRKMRGATGWIVGMDKVYIRIHFDVNLLGHIVWGVGSLYNSAA
jgi:hypothetical protein